MKVIKVITGSLQENCYIVHNDANTAVIVDPGDDAEKIIAKVQENGLTVKAILVTHAHFDHIGAVDELRDLYKIKSYVPVGEKEMIKDGYKNLSIPFLRVAITAEADELVDDKQMFDFGDGMVFETILVPGHSPYSICYYMKEFGCVFAGDTLFKQSVGRVDFYDGDKGDLVKNIKDRLLVLPDETIVYAGHGMNTKIGTEKKTNPFLSEEGLWVF